MRSNFTIFHNFDLSSIPHYLTLGAYLVAQKHGIISVYVSSKHENIKSKTGILTIQRILIPIPICNRYKCKNELQNL